LTAPRYAPASPTHPNLAAAEKLLEAWPDIAVQFPQLIDTIQPWTDTTMTPEFWLSVPGSSSHSLEDEFGIIMATVDSPIGLAQALVHEMAHHKLRAPRRVAAAGFASRHQQSGRPCSSARSSSIGAVR
jgi:HEXXH motif-containing protein